MEFKLTQDLFHYGFMGYFLYIQANLGLKMGPSFFQKILQVGKTRDFENFFFSGKKIMSLGL